MEKMEFDFSKRYILENEVALLRPLEPGDKDRLIRYSVSEPEIWKYNIHGGGGLAGFERYFDTAMKQFQEGTQYPFVVYDKRSGAYAGMTRIYDVSNEFRKLDIGYTWYGRQFQGTGLNKNCKFLLLSFAFDKLEMIRVGLGANSKNERSIHAMKAIGCKVEGILRQYSKDAEGNITDVIRLSILKSEWDEGGRINLKQQLERFGGMR